MNNSNTQVSKKESRLLERKEADKTIETEHLIDDLDFLWLEITPKCNLNCMHCYVSSSPSLPLYGNMNSEDWKRVINEAYDYGCRKTQFIGGEPTIHPDLPELIQHARKIGYEYIEVFSNGVVLTEKLRKVYIDNKVALAVSVYGPNSGVHDAITQHKGSFKKTMRTIHWALNEEVPIRVSIIEMFQNENVIQETCDMLKNIGVKSIGVDRVRGIGRGAEQSINNDPFTELCGQCWKGKLCVTTSGETYPCIMARSFPAGNILEYSINSVINDKHLAAFRERQQQFEYSFKNSTDSNNQGCRPCNPGCGPDECGPYWECRPEK